MATKLGRINLKKAGITSKCKLWKKPNKNGYGVIYIKDEYNITSCYPVHRHTYEKRYGKLPKSIDVHHICEVKRCYQWDHLKAVTKSEHRILHGETFTKEIATRFYNNLIALK